MSLFYKQDAAARFFVDQANGKVYEVVGGAAVLACSCASSERLGCGII